MGGAYNKVFILTKKTSGRKIKWCANMWATIFINKNFVFFANHDEALLLAISLCDKRSAVIVGYLVKLTKFLGNFSYSFQDLGSNIIFQGLIVTLSNNPA